MDRTELLRQMRDAKTPNEFATAIASVREWLREHPEDAELHAAMIQLLLVEESTV
jgi:antitoxin component HigA of HigAB toxin-antitoxin module